MHASDVELAGDRAPERWGLWALVAGGALITILTALWMTGFGGSDNPAQSAKDQASLLFVVSFGWTQILAFILLIFGLLALYALVAQTVSRGLALAGMVLGVLSLSAVIAGFGAVALGGAVVADSYLRGNTGTVDALNHFQGGSFGTAIMQALFAGMILAVLSAIASGLALWRATSLPRWVVIAFAVGFVLSIASIPIVSTVGGLLLIVSGVVFVRALAPAGVPSATARPMSSDPRGASAG